MQTTAFNNSLHRDIPIGVPSDWSDEAVIAMLVITPLFAKSFVVLMDALALGSVVIDIEISAETEMIELSETVVTSRLDKDALYAFCVRCGVVTDTLAVMLSDGAGIGVDVAAGVSASILAAGMSNIEFVMSSSLREESIMFGWPARSSLSMTLSDCNCALQARKPSDHV